jgi:hypothetical protein
MVMLKGLLYHFQEYVSGRRSRSFAKEMLYSTGWGFCRMNYGIGEAVAPFSQAGWCSGLDRMGEDDALQDLPQWEYSTDSLDEDTSDEDTSDSDASNDNLE